jgi:hypothetical protein
VMPWEPNESFYSVARHYAADTSELS